MILSFETVVTTYWLIHTHLNLPTTEFLVVHLFCR